MAKCDYPSDLKTFFAKKNGGTVTLSVEASMTRASIENGESPYTNYGKFSRFKFTFIDAQRNFIAASIHPEDDVPDMLVRTEYANQRIFECEMNKNSIATSENGERLSGPAYTVRFFSGSLKGKTPAEVLSEDPVKGSEALNRQYAWLKDNLQKYPSNQKQMDAIADAARLLKEGSLQKVEGGATGASITILPAEPHPNIYKEAKYGNKYPVSEISIVCYPENKYPYAISIENYYAPVIKRDDGTLNVMKKDMQDHVPGTFYMSTKDWNALMYAISSHMRQFEYTIAVQQFNEARAAEAENRKAAKAAKSGETGAA